MVPTGAPKSIRHFNRGSIRKRNTNLQIKNLHIKFLFKKNSTFLLRISIEYYNQKKCKKYS